MKNIQFPQQLAIFSNHPLNFGQNILVVMVYINGLMAEFMGATQIENQAYRLFSASLTNLAKDMKIRMAVGNQQRMSVKTIMKNLMAIFGSSFLLC